MVSPWRNLNTRLYQDNIFYSYDPPLVKWGPHIVDAQIKEAFINTSDSTEIQH